MRKNKKMKGYITNINTLLDLRFPNRECTLVEATEYLKNLLKDYTVVNMNYSFGSTDGEAIELYFSFKISLQDGRQVYVYPSGWYNGGNPQTGMDLINNFSLLEHCDSIATMWMETDME